MAESVEVTHLTVFDQCIRTHFSLLMCFALPEEKLPISDPSSAASQTTAHLQRGLDSLCLSIPFLKGRIRPCRINGAYTGSIEAVLDAGAPSPRIFVKDLTLAHPSFEALSVRGFPLEYFGAGVVLPQSANSVDDGQIFKLQANIISGGLILSVMAHHSFVDAQGLAVMIQQLGTHAVSGQAAPKLSAESIDRSPLFLGFPSDQPIKWARDLVPSEMPLETEPVRNTGVTGKIFRCSVTALKELQGKVLGLLGDTDVWVSTTDALSAFIWICVALARHDGTRDSEKFLHFYLNGRAKFKKPLPKSFVGNCVLECVVWRKTSQLFACSTAADTGSMGACPDKAKFEETVASIAVDVRRAIIKCDADRFREHIEAMYHYLDHRYNVGDGNFPVDHLGISSLFDLETYSVDFGGLLDKTSAVRLPDSQGNGMSLILPKGPASSLEYCLWLEDQSMQRLTNNPIWNELFTPVQ